METVKKTFETGVEKDSILSVSQRIMGAHMTSTTLDCSLRLSCEILRESSFTRKSFALVRKSLKSLEHFSYRKLKLDDVNALKMREISLKI